MPAVGARRKFGDQVGVWDGSAWVAETDETAAAPQPALSAAPKTEQELAAYVLSPEFQAMRERGQDEGARAAAPVVATMAAGMALPAMLPQAGVLGSVGRFLTSPTGMGTVAGAETLRRTGSPSAAIQAGVTTGIGAKGLGVGAGKLLKWFGRGAQAEAAAAAQIPRVSSGTTPAAVPLRIVPPRMSVPAPAGAAAPVAARTESAAVEAVKKIKASRAAKPATPKAEAPKPPEEASLEDQLKASVEASKGNPRAFVDRAPGPPPKLPSQEELTKYVTDWTKRGGLSKDQIANALKEQYGYKKSDWTKMVDMIVEANR